MAQPRRNLRVRIEADGPSVSVGLPVRNGARYLGRALDSILSQSLSSFELVISDNASSDDTEDICRDYARRDRRIRYIRQTRNIGGSANFNFVFDQAAAPYFKWAPHDDELAPDYLKSCVEALERAPDAVLCQTGITYIDEEGRAVGTYDSALTGTDSDDPVERFAATVLLPHPAYEVMSVFRRQALLGSLLIGPFHGCDRALVAQMALRGRFLKLTPPLLLVRDHAERYTRRMFKPRERLAWHAPEKATRFSMPNWRIYREYVRMVRSELVDRRQRRRCYLTLVRWWGHNWNAARVAIDPVAVLYPGIVTVAERTKQRWFGPAPGAGEARAQHEGRRA
jgi:glycosyltransferase involved in cell wall biosynthesis